MKHLRVRINHEILKKFKVICEVEGRSLNREIVFLIQKTITEYEEKYGKIKKDQDF